jgi:hypothetical protein
MVTLYPRRFSRAVLTFLLFFSAVASAQDVEPYRGGWMADIDNKMHFFYIVYRNDTLSGIYCVDCENPDNLAIIDDGTVSGNELDFVLYHYPGEGDAYTQAVSASFVNGELEVSFTGRGRLTGDFVFHQTPEDERTFLPMADYSMNQQPGNGPRMLPGEPEVLTNDSVTGLWLWGSGPYKQYFMFHEHKGGLRGLVCGPCDRVFDFAPLEQIYIDGTRLHFEITHEDNGAVAQHGPHSNVTDAVISMNEMHMSVIPSHAPEDFTPIEMTLFGPVIYRSN